MAENQTPQTKETAFFKTRLHGLKVVVGKAPEGELEAKSVAFVPYYERWDGDQIKVGYLKTSNAVAIEKLRADVRVEEIDQGEFEQGTDTERNKKPAVRAPY